MAGVAIGLWSVGAGLSGVGRVSPVEGDSERGPSAVWSEHLGLAWLEAAQVDPGAVLYGITAEPYDVMADWLSPDSPLEVTFDFMGREGTFSISTVDSKPPRVLYVTEMFRFDEMRDAGMTVPDRAKVLSRADYLRIKPRLALTASLPDGIRFERVDGDYVYPYLELDLATNEEEPAWVVVYEGTTHDLEVWMDAKSGEILSRDVEKIEYDEWDG